MPRIRNLTLLAGTILMTPTPSLAEPQAVLTVDRTWDGEPIPASERVELRLRRHGEAIEITVDAPYHGDPPPPGPPGSLDGLWDYEVVELFIAGPPEDGGAVPYTEVELSPHGHYLVLRLEGVRHAVERGLPLELTSAIEGNRWYATALLPVASLPAEPWSANAYAIHGAAPERRYLAMLPVHGKRPDFHRPELFRPLSLK